jgi:hypothetical protein
MQEITYLRCQLGAATADSVSPAPSGPVPLELADRISCQPGAAPSDPAAPARPWPSKPPPHELAERLRWQPKSSPTELASLPLLAAAAAHELSERPGIEALLHSVHPPAMQALDASTESLLAAHGETGLGLLTSYHTN